MLNHITNLPNLFTTASIFCGFYSLVLASEATAGDTETLYRAALAIIFAAFFDALDGRVARLTNTSSEFGIQYDSLADVISFGVAPAFLLYKWGLAFYGGLGLAISFLYLSAGAMRLARFNIITKKMSNRYSLGLTITESGGMVAGIVVVHHRIGAEYVYNHLNVALSVLVLAYLMVSNIRFRTFKDVRLSQKTVLVLGVFFVTAAWLMRMYHDSVFVLVFLGTLHIFSGLIEEVVFFKRRRLEELQASLEEADAGMAVSYYRDGEQA
jgi:CDP-diacylglycerol--serine O-phosphatidyltransferase